MEGILSGVVGIIIVVVQCKALVKVSRRQNCLEDETSLSLSFSDALTSIMMMS